MSVRGFSLGSVSAAGFAMLLRILRALSTGFLFALIFLVLSIFLILTVYHITSILSARLLYLLLMVNSELHIVTIKLRLVWVIVRFNISVPDLYYVM